MEATHATTYQVASCRSAADGATLLQVSPMRELGVKEGLAVAGATQCGTMIKSVTQNANSPQHMTMPCAVPAVMRCAVLRCGMLCCAVACNTVRCCAVQRAVRSGQGMAQTPALLHPDWQVKL